MFFCKFFKKPKEITPFEDLLLQKVNILLWQNKKLRHDLASLNYEFRKLKKILTPESASVIEFYTEVDGTKQKVEHMFLKISQSLPLNLSIKDKLGNPAKVDGAPQWSVTDASLGSVVASEDGFSAVFTPSGPIGSFKVQVSADADLGEGVKSLLGELDIDLLAGEAVSLELSAGTPVDLP